MEPTVTASLELSTNVSAMKAGRAIPTKAASKPPLTSLLVLLCSVELKLSAPWPLEDLNVCAKRASPAPTLMPPVLILMNARTTFAEKMHNVSTPLVDTTADVSSGMWAILSRPAQSQEKTGKISAPMSNAARMPFVILVSVFVLKDSRETIHMML